MSRWRIRDGARPQLIEIQTKSTVTRCHARSGTSTPKIHCRKNRDTVSIQTGLRFRVPNPVFAGLDKMAGTPPGRFSRSWATSPAPSTRLPAAGSCSVALTPRSSAAKNHPLRWRSPRDTAALATSASQRIFGIALIEVVISVLQHFGHQSEKVMTFSESLP